MPRDLAPQPCKYIEAVTAEFCCYDGLDCDAKEEWFIDDEFEK